MNISFVIDRIKSVVRSCETKEQTAIARKYCSRLIEKWEQKQLEDSEDGFSSWSFRNYIGDVAFELNSFLFDEIQNVIFSEIDYDDLPLPDTSLPKGG